MHDDEGKLHVQHAGGTVSLFNPSTNELVLLEAPQEELKIIVSAISPNADYIAFLRFVGHGEGNGKIIYETIVKRKLNDTDWNDLFGCKDGRET